MTFSLSPSRLSFLLLSAAALVTTGCGLGTIAAPGPITSTAALQGAVHGGQQPVVGATIQLYAAGTTGYGSAARPLIASTVKSIAGGGFTITGTYTCNPGDLLYITATGGNPGIAGTQNNSALTLMAGLGPCSTISAGTSIIQINELSTVASVWALAPFATNITHIGTSSTNIAGLTNAFAAINNIVNLTTGAIPGPNLPAGATLPTAEINTLADILAACVNTVDTISPAAQSSTCQTLFSGSAAAITPTETVQAALNLAHYPFFGLTLGTSLVTASAPFQTTLTAAPTSWTIAINYIGGGITAPNAIATDQSGNVWTTNTASVSKLSPTGAPLSGASGFTVGSLNIPLGIAIDTAGNAWVANSGSNSLTQISSTGATGTNFIGGGLSSPRSPAIDAAGNIWLLNHTTSTLSEFTSAGTPITSTTGFTNSLITAPTVIAISPR